MSSLSDLTPMASWMSRGACKGKAHVMFPLSVGHGHRARQGTYDEAAALCRACPVRQQCEDYALTAPDMQDSGYIAGMSPHVLRERRGKLRAAEAKRRTQRLKEAS